MEPEIVELQKRIELLTKANAELLAERQECNSQKQSFMRMSTRLRKLCKRLTPSNEIVVEMQQLASDIKALARDLTK